MYDTEADQVEERLAALAALLPVLPSRGDDGEPLRMIDRLALAALVADAGTRLPRVAC